MTKNRAYRTQRRLTNRTIAKVLKGTASTREAKAYLWAYKLLQKAKMATKAQVFAATEARNIRKTATAK